MVVGGYSQITAALSTSLDVRLDHAAQQVSVTDSGVCITCSNGENSSTQLPLQLPAGCGRLVVCGVQLARCCVISSCKGDVGWWEYQARHNKRLFT